MAVTHPLLAHIRRRIDPSALEMGSDASLLSRFVRQNDEAAFSALVARHGPMVYRLCYRVLGDGHAAEDAVQATFLVLAQKAAGLRHPETLAAWLHGVAYRLALKSRAGQLRRRQVEKQCLQVHPAPASPDPLAEVTARELLTLLDAELQRLPERYRLPFILCCLEGRSQHEAARLLGWTPGSVKGRLERGRVKLHQRLLRRGLTLPAALLAMEAARGAASVHLPAPLKAAILGAGSLAEASMVSARLKLVSVLVLMGGLLAGGLGAFAYPQLAVRQEVPGPNARSQPPAPQAAAPPAPPQKRPATDRYGDPLPPGAYARLGTIRLRHSFQAYPLANRDAFISVSSGGGDTAAYVWRTSTGELLRRFDLPVRRPGSAVSADGKTLAVHGYDERRDERRIALVDVHSGKVTGEWATESDTYALAFTPDGKTLASAGSGNILYLWDARNGKELRRFQADTPGWWSLAFSPDGKILAAAGLQQRTVQLWDVATGRPLRSLGAGPGVRSSVVFSPDGKTLASASGEDRVIRLWDVATGKEVRQLRGESGTYSLAFSRDGKVLATGGVFKDSGQLQVSPIQLWDVSTGKEVRRLPGHVFAVTSVAFSADGKWLISASSSAVVRVWDIQTGKEALPFAAPESWVTSVAFSPDGRSLAAGSLDGTIRLWEPASGKPARLFEGGVHPQVLHVAFSPDGRTLVSDQSDGSLRVWDVAAGRQRRRFPVGEDHHSYPFAYSPDGRALAVWQEDGSIRLLDAATGKEQRRLAGAAGDGAHLCFSPDNTMLASLSFSYGARTSYLHVWDTTTWKEKRKWTLAEAGPIVFSPDSRTLLGSTGLHSLRTGAATRILHACDVDSGEDHPFPVTQHDRINCLAISPDGRMLAWGDAGGIITLWDLAAGQVRRRLKGHLSRIEAVAFSPDGRTLASGSADTTVLLWDVTGRPAGGHLGPLSEERLSALWEDLASTDAGKAFAAIGLLAAAPEQAVALLKTKLQPAPAPAERRQMSRLIADLDSDELAVRQKAMAAIRQLGERAEPALRDARRSELTLEARKRIDELLNGARTRAASGKSLRPLRAVEVLEQIGTPDAQKELQTLADGPPTARLTCAAKASLERIRKRQRTKP